MQAGAPMKPRLFHAACASILLLKADEKVAGDVKCAPVASEEKKGTSECVRLQREKCGIWKRGMPFLAVAKTDEAAPPWFCLSLGNRDRFLPAQETFTCLRLGSGFPQMDAPPEVGEAAQEALDSPDVMDKPCSCYTGRSRPVCREQRTEPLL